MYFEVKNKLVLSASVKIKREHKHTAAIETKKLGNKGNKEKLAIFFHSSDLLNNK